MAQRAVVVASTSGTFVIGLVLKALMFNNAVLTLGGTLERMDSIADQGARAHLSIT